MAYRPAMVRRLGVRVALSSVLLAALSATLTGCGGGPDPDVAHPSHGSAGAAFEPTARDLEAIRALVARRAAALDRDDVDAFLATVDPRNASFRSHQRTLFDNLTRLRGLRVRYTVDTGELLVPDPVPGSDPTLRPTAVEHVRFATLTHPVGNPVHLTFVRRDGRWTVGAETEEDDPSGLQPAQERPWYGVPIAVRTTGPMTVVVDDHDRAGLGALTAEIRDDISVVASLLHLPARYRLLVDATTNGGSTSFSSTSDEQAAAVTFGVYDTDRGGTQDTRFAGMVIKLNPRLVDRLSTNTGLLRHELTHYLLSADYSGGSPKWLSEGIATWVQYYPDDFADLSVPSDLYQRIRRADRRLPVVGLFNDDPGVNYPIAQAA